MLFSGLRLALWALERPCYSHLPSPLCLPTQEPHRLGRPLEHPHCWVPQFKADPVTLRSLLSGTTERIAVMHRPLCSPVSMSKLPGNLQAGAVSALFPASTGVHGGAMPLLRSTQSRVQEGPQHGLYLPHPDPCPGHRAATT